MIEQLLLFLSVSALLTLSPGPDILYVVTQSVSNGSRSGIATALGLVSGIPVHTTFIAFGMAAVIRDHPSLFTFIKILGALYLLYLAWMTYRADARIRLSDSGIDKADYWKLYQRGLMMNLINPKVIIFFLAFFPGFLWDPLDGVRTQFYVLGFVFLLQALAIFVLASLFSAALSVPLRENDHLAVVLKWIQVFVFIGIAVYIVI